MALKVSYPPSEGFRVELKRRVREYLDTAEEPTRGIRRMGVKTAAIAAWVIVSYVLMVFVATELWQGLLCAVSLGLAFAGVGFSIQHDANHEAYRESRWQNRLLGFSLDLLGGSSYVWRQKHNYFHHQFTNIAGIDDDIDVGLLARFSPEQPWRWWHRFQRFYIWPLYGMLPIKWILYDDFQNIISGKIGDQPMRQPGRGEMAALIVGKVLALTQWLIIPLIFQPVGYALLCAFVASFVLGVALATVFQLAHCVGEAEFYAPVPGSDEMPREWAVHQIETTVDFGRNNPFVTWYLGGLNFQVEHHLFPRVCHLHYPAISKIVEEMCAERGVVYRDQPRTLKALASHYRLLRELGSGPAPAPEAQALAA